jgi:hypothetical protein
VFIPSTASAAPPGGAQTRAVGSAPLSSSAAAGLVHRRAWEPRPQNGPYAHPPSLAELAYFHKYDGQTDDCGLRAHVDGDFSGTTDETIQWTAWKWGIDEDLVRAEAEAESTWDHYALSFVRPGDDGVSFGLFEIKVGVHKGFDPQADGGGSPSPGGGSAGASMSLNADYYGYVIRAAMNGCEGWLADADTATHPYPATDTDEAQWGAVGRWFSGAWWRGSSDAYRSTVRDDLDKRDWVNASWFYGSAGPWPPYGRSQSQQPSASAAAAEGARRLAAVLSSLGLRRLARRGSARVMFRAPVAGTERFTVSTGRSARRRSRVLAAGRRLFTNAGSGFVRVHLTRRARVLAGRAGSLSVVLRSVFVPRGGPAANSSRRVRLRR